MPEESVVRPNKLLPFARPHQLLLVGNSTEKVSGTNLVVLNSVKQSSKQLLLSKLAAKEYTSPKANYSSLYPNADFCYTCR